MSWDSRERAEEFMRSDSLREAMQKGGVTSEPKATWLEGRAPPRVLRLGCSASTPSRFNRARAGNTRGSVHERAEGAASITDVRSGAYAAGSRAGALGSVNLLGGNP